MTSRSGRAAARYGVSRESRVPERAVAIRPLDRIDAEAAQVLLQELQRNAYSFTTVTPLTHAHVNARFGNEQARNLRDVFGWSRPFAAELLSPSLWELLRRADLLERDGALWRSRVRVSALDGKLFLHSAYPTADADAVFFGPDSYRFCAALRRQLAAGESPLRRAVDIGCGAGPGAIAIAAAAPAAEVYAVDINAAALRITAINAAAAQLRNVTVRHSDLLTGVDGLFDLVIANPPYLIDPSERAYRHGGGDFGEGLALAIVEAALPRLAPRGVLLLYTGVAIVDGTDPFFDAMRTRLDAAGMTWRYEELDPDIFSEELLDGPYRRAERIAAVVLTVQADGRQLPNETG